MLDEMIELYVNKRIDTLSLKCDEETKEVNDQFLKLMCYFQKCEADHVLTEVLEFEHLMNMQKLYFLKVGYESGLREGITICKELFTQK